MNINTSEDAYKELDKLSKEWATCEKQVIILDEGKKATFSKCFLKHKQFVKTTSEAEHLARTDDEYKKIIHALADAESNLIKARYGYNNLDRYLSYKQTEMKTNIQLINKQ